jgi:hypothetical protein
MCHPIGGHIRLDNNFLPADRVDLSDETFTINSLSHIWCGMGIDFTPLLVFGYKDL